MAGVSSGGVYPAAGVTCACTTAGAIIAASQANISAKRCIRRGVKSPPLVSQARLPRYEPEMSGMLRLCYGHVKSLVASTADDAPGEAVLSLSVQDDAPMTDQLRGSKSRCLE